MRETEKYGYLASMLRAAADGCCTAKAAAAVAVVRRCMDGIERTSCYEMVMHQERLGGEWVLADLEPNQYARLIGYRCPFGNETVMGKTSICKATTGAFKGILEATGRNASVFLVRSIARGDACCEVRITCRRVKGSQCG